MKKFLMLASTFLSLSNPALANNCEKTAEFKQGSYVWSNNVWNAEDKNLAQCINTRGWIWSMKSNGDMPQSFPSVIFGHKPWAKKSTTKLLPAKIETLNLKAQGSVKLINASGKFNTAFDIWLSSSKEISPESITTEVMIWLNSKNMQPAGRIKHEIVVDGVNFDVWTAPMNSWDYIALTLEKNDVTEMQIDVAHVLNELAKIGLVKSQHYVASVEFGTEIISGSGSAEVQFEVK